LQRLSDQQAIERVAMDRGEASSPLEPLQDLLRQRSVEVVWNRERSGAETERPWTGLSRGNRAQLSDRKAAAEHNEVLPGLNPIQ
jgi:hypothetical protein